MFPFSICIHDVLHNQAEWHSFFVSFHLTHKAEVNIFLFFFWSKSIVRQLFILGRSYKWGCCMFSRIFCSQILFLTSFFKLFCLQSKKSSTQTCMIMCVIPRVENVTVKTWPLSSKQTTGMETLWQVSVDKGKWEIKYNTCEVGFTFNGVAQIIPLTMSTATRGYFRKKDGTRPM